MSRYERTPTDILVVPVDLTEVEAHALAYLRAHAQTDIDLGKEGVQMPSKVRVGWKHGIVTTPDGDVYALNTEGVGPNHPITNEQPLDVDVFIEGYEDDTSEFLSMFPACLSKVGVDELRNYATGEPVNLADFVRTFGSRLDDNYESWRRLLTERKTTPVTG
jgi:hypothetical protein